MKTDLKSWARMSHELQLKRIARWYKSDRWHIYEVLAFEAANILKIELTDVSPVTGVYTGGGNAIGRGEWVRVLELVLVVCTLLPDCSMLEDIPSHFKGFDVRQLHLGERRKAFIATWKILFKELRGWSEEETLQWAEQWDDALSGRQPPDAIYHYGPIKVALSGLWDEGIRRSAGSKLMLLRKDVFMLLMEPKGIPPATTQYPDFLTGYDWDDVRYKFNELVKKYT